MFKTLSKPTIIEWANELRLLFKENVYLGAEEMEMEIGSETGGGQNGGRTVIIIFAFYNTSA